jgi:hypothetical protein
MNERQKRLVNETASHLAALAAVALAVFDIVQLFDFKFPRACCQILRANIESNFGIMPKALVITVHSREESGRSRGMR